MEDTQSHLDELRKYPVWDGLSLQQLIPLLESTTLEHYDSSALIFEQFHPATDFHLLLEGEVLHTGTSESRTDTIPFGPVDWRFAALGWSGFLQPQRYGTTARARTTVIALRWSHSDLAAMFYADPRLSLPFFDLVLESVHRQLADLCRHRLTISGPRLDPPKPSSEPLRRPVRGLAENCLRRSAFFSAFDEEVLESLARDAEPSFFAAGQLIVAQGETVDGILLLASGRCNAFLVDAADGSLLPFRRLGHHIGVIAALPLAENRFAAEASVYAETGCWIYRIAASSLAKLKATDPETGRAFQHRLLTRLAALIAAVRVVQGQNTPEPEATAVATIIANNQTRLPVSSDLHKVPHLLRNRLTVGNAFAVLDSVASIGRYPERQLAAQCSDLLGNVAAEHGFYHGILKTCDAVMNADETLPVTAVRQLCDEMADAAFAHLDTRVHNLSAMPTRPGNIVVMNHLACPVHYELPNHYHFSFDTAFVSCLIWRHFGKSGIRVVRESPGAEFGHNLFYRRLQPITVPTIESGVDASNPGEFAQMRRQAGLRFNEQGRELLQSGENLLLCPEGQSQNPEHSPARFHTGAFRLALAANAPLIPVALGGFHRRYKDGPLVAIVGDPVNVATAMQESNLTNVRDFTDAFRDDFAVMVDKAMEEARQPAQLVHPD